MYYNQKVDFHSHFLTKTYYEYLKKYEDEMPDGFPTPEWSIESHIASMDKLGIAFSFMTVSSPNLSGADRDEEIRMVHQINIEGAEAVKERPDRLGLFASLPLPHVEDAVKEAAFALDELKADGFGLSTHYAGVYLGDRQYDPLMEYLNERKAIIAVHPVTPSAVCPNINDELPIPAMEFFMDTTRTFTFMVLNNIFERYPEIRWIFPHAGSFIPVLSDRIAGFSIQFRSRMQNDYPVDFKSDMRHVYFDIAGFAVNKQIHDLLLDVSHKNLLYGSDAPYTPSVGCVSQTGALEKTEELTEDQKADVFTFNAVALVPRLGSILKVTVTGLTVCYADKKLTLKERINRRIRKVMSWIYGKIFK